ARLNIILEGTNDAADLEVQALARVKCNLRDDVRHQVRRVEHVAGIVENAAGETGKRVGQSDGRGARRTADVLVRIFERDTRGHLIFRSVDQYAHARLPRPREADQ